MPIQTKLKNTGKEAIGLSQITGKDLSTSMRIVISANEGWFNQLQRLIPGIATAGNSSQKFAVYLKAISEGFILAQISTQSAGGQVDQFNKKIEMLKILVGEKIIIGLLPFLNELGDWIQAHQEDIANFVGTIATFIKKEFLPVLRDLLDLLDKIEKKGSTTVVMQSLFKFLASTPFVKPFITKEATQEYIKNIEIYRAELIALTFTTGNVIAAMEILSGKNITPKITPALTLQPIPYKSNEVEMEKYQKEWNKLSATIEAQAEKNWNIIGKYADEYNQELLQTTNKNFLDNLPGFRDFQKLYLAIQKQKEVVKDYFANWLAGAKILDVVNLYIRLITGIPWENVGEKTEKVNIKWREYAAILTVVTKSIEGIENLSNTLGINLTAFTTPLKSATTGFTQISTGVEALGKAKTEKGMKGTVDTFTSWADIIGGIARGLSAVIGLAKSFLSLFHTGLKHAIEDETSWMDLTKKQTKALTDLAKQGYDAHNATSQMLADFIKEADITTKNIDQWAQRVRGILSDLDAGTMNQTKTAELIGAAWTALKDKMVSLNLTGITKGMIDIIADLRNRGIQVADIQSFVSDALSKGVGALSNVYKGISSVDSYNNAVAYTLSMFNALVKEGKSFTEIMTMMSEPLNALIKYQKKYGTTGGALDDILGISRFISKNKDLADSISSLVDLEKSLGDTAYMTSDLFNKFGADAQSRYQKLLAKGADPKQALMMMAPFLGEQLWLAKEYGYKLDAATQKMIDDAAAKGINIKANEDQKSILSDSRNYLKDIRDKLCGTSSIGAQHGYQGWVTRPTVFTVAERQPEYVRVSPTNNTANEYNTTININGYNQNPDDLAKKLLIVLKNNVRGVSSVVGRL